MNNEINNMFIGAVLNRKKERIARAYMEFPDGKNVGITPWYTVKFLPTVIKELTEAGHKWLRTEEQ